MKKTLGGDRLGSGRKMEVDLHGYSRSTHDRSYLFRSTMSAGTLVPFMHQIGLPGDTFDIDLECDMKTHPTIGPLFGSYKVQLDIFMCPLRLYNAKLHNNALNIGMNMKSIFLPSVSFQADAVDPDIDVNNQQVNPSSIMAYLGIRGFGTTATPLDRRFNAAAWISYWDVYKNYYANKQEEIGAVVHTPQVAAVVSLETLVVEGEGNIAQAPGGPSNRPLTTTGAAMTANWDNLIGEPDWTTILIYFSRPAGGDPGYHTIASTFNITGTASGTTNFEYNGGLGDNVFADNWRYQTGQEAVDRPIEITTFDLENLDTMRNNILAEVNAVGAFDVNTQNYAPFNLILGANQGSILASQEGLGIKTYQSDLFNNWLQTEWIDGPTGINQITAISTTGDEFTIDQFLLAKKVYDMMNRIAVSGGTYNDWLDATYTDGRKWQAESPMYMGGLIRELVFQEVVSNAESAGDAESGSQPLGTLAGKGVLGGKKKGGHVVVKVEEPSYILGIISLTPRVDYSQGNTWDVHLETIDDLHKPGLDGIGFQDLITEQMAWWSTTNVAGEWVQKSAGKQPAWVNYMTEVNRTFGNFAMPDNEMFMTLNRRYDQDPTTPGEIDDLTTYIHPAKFNHIFAETSLDSQNFWAQIAVDITWRGLISAKVMPNL